jgi:hypothetical protein
MSVSGVTILRGVLLGPCLVIITHYVGLRSSDCDCKFRPCIVIIIAFLFNISVVVVDDFDHTHLQT